MTTNRQLSRRRLAALTFLSNISLDGTHRDTRLCHYNRTGFSPENAQQESDNIFDLVIECKENIYDSAEQSQTSVALRKNLGNIISDEAKHEFSPDEAACILDGGGSSPKFAVATQHVHFNERDGTLSEERGIRKKPSYQAQHAAAGEKLAYFSSCESLGSIIQPVPVGRTRKPSSSLSESSGPTPCKDVKLLSGPHRQSVREERFILVSSRKIPVHIFSAVPYSKLKYAGKTEFQYSRSESVRQRHASGSRVLSTIADNSDVRGICSSEKTDESSMRRVSCRELSYSHLLIPSRSYYGKPLRQNSEQSGADYLEGSERMIHPGIARCFSYEHSTHRTTAHYIPQYNMHVSESGSIAEWEEWRNADPAHVASLPYHPDILDDPELRAGKHRKLLQFTSYMTSVIDYTKPCELKKELNDKFRDKFPCIQLTLSKLRSLKREMLKIARQECDIDLLTVAQAYVYFEQLILKTSVNKQNRKLIAGACLLLSAKMNDVKGEVLSKLIEKIEGTFRLNRRDLLHWEFLALVLLEFGLHVPTWYINAHYQRLLFEF